MGLLADSSKGVPPYQYQIVGGPQTYASQSDNFFTFTVPGTYTARISDTCGFAQTFTFSVDTLSFQQVVKVGSSCLGNTATLICQHSPYAAYSWVEPDGSTFDGDTLMLNPVTAANYGVYHITKYVNVNNCRDTVYATYTLSNNSITNLYDSVCAGQSVTFAGHVYAVPGIYYDTIPTTVCDSVVILNLSSRQTYDSVALAICSGQHVIVGSHTYNSTGIYRDTLISAGGCDSIHVLNLTVGGMKYDSTAQTICSGQSINVASHTYNTSGVYRDTLISAGGCDSLHVLNLTVGGMKYDSTAQTICSGQSVNVASHTYTTTGIYRDTLISAGGCDSVHVLNLTVGGMKYDSTAQTICSGQSVFVASHSYSSTGIFRDTLITAGGCDSVHVLNLTVSGMRYDSTAQTICSGQSVTVASHNYNSTGIFRDTLITTGGCDSVHVLNLTVIASGYDSVAINICSGQTVTVASHIYNATGVYRDTLVSFTGCDSIYVLDLTVAPVKYDSVTRSICTGQSFTTGSHTYNTTGIYRDTLTTANGCDSIHVLNLQVVNVLFDSTAQSICSGQSIARAGHLYNTTGVYRDTLPSSGGCDSVSVLNLTVNNVKRDTIAVNFCSGDSAVINGFTYSTGGTYTDTFATTACDSIRTLVVTVSPKPTIQISASNTIVTAGDTVQLNVSGSSLYSYYWSSLATLSNTASANPVATPVQSAWVRVSAGYNSCFTEDSVYITVQACVGNLFAPNAFTPNSDGNNDDYRVYAKCAELQRLQIFNRWGELVWETTNIEQGWNGYYKGTLQQPGVYVYLLTYSVVNNGNGEVKQMKGSITLIR